MKVQAVHVHFFDQDVTFILQEMRDKLTRGYVSQGEHVAGFEQDFAEYTGARHAVAVSSGSAAIEIAMRLQNVSGQTVLVPANTNFATAIGPLRAGAKIKLVDIDPLTLSPGVEDLEAAWTPEVTGVIIVHMGGIISPAMPKIRAWCAAKDVWLFEDCAHAHGSRLEGRHAGRFGLAGGFSFFATKVITSGEGGMIVTDDPTVAQEARLRRNMGKPELWTSYHTRLDTNSRMGEFSALVGRVQLGHLDEFIAWRKKVAEQYTDLLADHSLLRPILPTDESSWYKYPVLLPENVERDRLKADLRERGVHLAGEIYALPLHQQPALVEMFNGLCFPKTEDVCARHICLPIYYTLSSVKVEYVVRTLTTLLEEYGAE